MTNVTIIEMEHHFLYLPVYFARSKNFFGHIGAEYSTKIVQAAAGTDLDAFQRLARGEAELAICDPCALIYASQIGFVPVVLAAVVARGAFWAINTNSPEVTELDHLALFEHIISFHPGTTSHGIATRIRRSAKGKVPTIESVRPLQELTKLEDLIRDKKSVVALSPDVLRIERSMEANLDWKVKLALADTVEYAHVLVTAIVGRPDFVGSHPNFINGFLKALQRSLIHARVEDPELLAYASDSFNQPAAVVKKAVSRANAAQVWASDITVSEDLWLNAVQAHYDSLGQPFEGDTKRGAQRIFAESFKPSVDRAQKAAIELLADKKDPLKSSLRLKHAALAAVGAATGVCGLLAWQSHPTAQLPFAVGVVYLPLLADFRGRKHLIGWNALLLVLFLSVWFVHYFLHRASEEAYIGTLFALVLFFAEANFSIIRKKHG
ncbi:MAG: hypothetical protein LC794_17595 [Acidobacteria bacterium]|nr:hypothetical protein [Acidobacteriota bacterium]